MVYRPVGADSRRPDWRTDDPYDVFFSRHLPKRQRAFVRQMLDEFEDEQRGRVIDLLMACAARGDADSKPNRPISAGTSWLTPRLGTPSIATLIQGVSSTITLAEEDLRSMVDAMRVAAERRVEAKAAQRRRPSKGYSGELTCHLGSPGARVRCAM